MPIKICPNCNKRFTIGFDTNDFIHECNSGNAAIDNEDVLIIGDWEDFSGSGTIGPQEVMRQGTENKLQGTRAGIEGEDLEDTTRRGARASTHRQRQFLNFLELKGGK